MTETRTEPTTRAVEATIEIEAPPEAVWRALTDARELIREELAMFRTELRDEMRKGKSAGITFATAAVLGFVGLFVLALALGGALAAWLDWPQWPATASSRCCC